MGTNNPLSWSRRRLLATGLGGVVLGVAGCTSDGEGPTDTEANGDGDGGDGDTGDGAGGQASAQTTVKLGEVVEGDNLKMVARSTETTKKLDQFTEADQGNTFLIVRLAVKNASDGFVNFSSFLQARVKDASNNVYDASITGTKHALGSDVLASGEVARGDMMFEVPESISEPTLQFDFSTFDLFKFDRVTVTLSETASQTGDLSQSLNVPVRSPGETVTHSDVGVTLHGTRTTSEAGQFATPNEGNEFLVTDIEIANDADEALAVSSLLQMAVKDERGLRYGSDIAATSQLDKKYSEGSEIAPGASRRGEIAYEIATDVEVAYWTFNFLDFDAEKKAFWKMKG